MRFLVYVAAGLVLGALLFVAKVVFAGGLPEGPVAAVWDHEACAFCRMHVGEPAFAAQLQTKDGQVLFFDDPGCLFETLDRDQPLVHALYFRHMQADRWLARDEVAFAQVAITPMGYGIGAVERGTAGALSVDEAHAKVRKKREER
ncbi:MAG TPA: hypothetical protein PKE00_06650 [Planctomycetota bacterium]|nr:hypothetical protein [Planctomycetota bacterium]